MFLVIDTRTGGDWTLDLCFAGLINNLGPWRVSDWPAKTKHREWTSYEDADWGKERRTLGYTDRNNSCLPLTEHEIKAAVYQRQIEGIFIDEREESFLEYQRLGLQHSGIPVYVVSGHDRFWNRHPEVLWTYYKADLKAFLTDHPNIKLNGAKNIVCSWSVNFDHYWERPELFEKKWDISFFGYNSHPDRQRYIDFIRKEFSHLNLNLVLETQPDTTKNFIPKREYFQMIGESKISLNLRGAADGGKTLRFWEIPYVGSCMLTQAPGNPISNPVPIEYVQFNDEKSLAVMIETLLSDPIGRETIAEQSHKEVMQNHTVTERWKRILKDLNVSF